jgi:hypothetical protein
MRTFQSGQKQPPQRTSFSTAKQNTTTPWMNRGMSRETGSSESLQHTVESDGVSQVARAEKSNDLAPASSHAEFAHNFASIAIFPSAVHGMQRKLMVNVPGDAYEQEADHVADQVMRMAEPGAASSASPARSTAVAAGVGLQRECACGGSCDDCKKKKEEGKENKPLQMKPAGPASLGGIEAPAIVHDVLRSSGQPLDAGTRAFMEPRFGHDFSKVRVHTDAKAVESARAVQARAYTVGSDVVFGANCHLDQGDRGRGLIAHELAHVLQQTRGAGLTLARKPTKSGVSNNDYSFSNNCGWIDWGHANPKFARKLIANVQQASDDLKTAGAGTAPTGSSPTMTAKKVGIVFSSASMQVTLARPLSPDEVLAVSLSMFKNLSVIFEIQQEWTDWLSGSAFSQEDLPSNLISFYRAARGFSPDQIKQYCASQDVSTSLQEFDKNSTFQKNHSFSPIGVQGKWPAELSTIDETKGESLYKVANVSVGGPVHGSTVCPLYRIEGTIDDTDLFIISVGGSTFTAADDVRVVPTYRVDPDRMSGQGHVLFLEVKPWRPSDAKIFKEKGISAPLFVPETALTCIEMEGGSMSRSLMRNP